MGCGASTPGPAAGSEADERRPDALQTPSDGDEPIYRMVTDMNGDQAYVQIHDHPWNDLTVFDRARSKAEAANAAYEEGALRSALKNTITSPERLRSQRRVVSLSFAAAAPAAGAESSGPPVKVSLQSAGSAKQQNGS